MIYALLFVAQLLDTDSFFQMESVGNPAISPDGKLIVFGRSHVDKMKDQNRTTLWMINQDGTRLRELTNGSAPVWSPDGKKIAFLSDRDGTNQLHVMWVDTREVAQLTRLDRAPSDITWSPDGKSIAYTQRALDEDPILPIKMPKKPEGAVWAKGATVIDRPSWASDGVGPVAKGYTHIYVVDAIQGGTPKQITSGKYNHTGPEWSPDSSKIYFSGIRKPEAEFTRNDSEVYVADLKTGAVTAMTDRKGPDRTPKVSPDGKWVAYMGYDDKKYTSHLASIYLMATDGSGKKAWASGLPSSPDEVMWAPDSSGVYFSMKAQGKGNLYWLERNGGPKQLTEGIHVLSAISLSDAGTAAAVRTSFHTPPELVTFDVKRPGAITSLVDLNRDVLADKRLGKVEEMWFNSSDGLKVQGWLIQPSNYQAGKKYPMVLYIHGGPWSDYTVAWNWAWQHFAANGYAVLYINPRGSTGYGQEFVNGIQYSYPGKDYDDLMAGVDAAIAKGFVDANNLFVCGGSGGGVLTAWIVGHTNRFRAAVSMRPVIDWVSFVGTTDGISWYDQFEKYPWDDASDHLKRSPLTYVKNVMTPTMVMTGEADLRTPITQSEEYYRALKVLKKETLLVRMPDEFHGWRRPTHQLAQQLYLLAWFEKHMKRDK
ncbi:MAG: S9 family peptidase [Acidobacteria bacterium]|nr:S9 family peptidase [Acidobacteriota bacterium]